MGRSVWRCIDENGGGVPVVNGTHFASREKLILARPDDEAAMKKCD